MPKFSADSFSKLSTCHADLQTIFYEVIKYVDCTILEGYRDQQHQDEDFAAGRSQLKWPNGRHNANPSNAVDVSPFPIDWQNTPRFYWFGGFVLAIAEVLLANGKITHKVRWGGDWSGKHIFTDQKFKDLVHFELIV